MAMSVSGMKTQLSLCLDSIRERLSADTLSLPDKLCMMQVSESLESIASALGSLGRGAAADDAEAEELVLSLVARNPDCNQKYIRENHGAQSESSVRRAIESLVKSEMLARTLTPKVTRSGKPYDAHSYYLTEAGKARRRGQ